MQLIEFLDNTNPEVQALAAEHISGLSEDSSFVEFVKSNLTVLDKIISKAETSLICANHTMSALINLSRDAAISGHLEQLFLPYILSLIVNKSYPMADLSAMLLSNITKRESAVDSLLGLRLNGTPVLEVLLDIFCQSRSYNKDADFHFLASVFADITRIQEGRLFFVVEDAKYLKDLLPFTTHDNLIRKGGCTSAIKNCCFETEFHSKILEDSFSLLPAILLPLAGPEEMSEDDMDGMPVELHFLEASKKREIDPALRKIFVEILVLLGVSKEGREVMRKRKVYPILRDLHKVETDEQVENQIEEIVQLLIRDESS